MIAIGMVKSAIQRVLGVTVFAIAACGSVEDGKGAPSAAERLHASAAGSLIVLLPTNIVFQPLPVPIDNARPEERTLALDPKSIDALKDPRGEWDPQFAAIIESVVPLKECICHIGDDGWGEASASWFSLHMRVYEPTADLAEIDRRISTDGLATARRLGKDAAFADRVVGDWRIARIDVDLHFDDYGGRASVEFAVTTIADRRLVVVLMFAGDQPNVRNRDRILRSFEYRRDE